MVFEDLLNLILILTKLDIETKIMNFLYTILLIMLQIKKYNFYVLEIF